MTKFLILAAAVIISGCGGTDSTSPAGGNPNTAPSRSISVTAGNNPLGILGNYLPSTPQMTVADALGHPVANATVTFAASGGGRVTGFSVQTDASGNASPMAWRLGPTGAQELTATTAGATPVTVTAQALPVPASTFHIEVRYAAGTTPTATQVAAFEGAAARWSQLLLQGGSPVTVQEYDAGCGDLRGETVNGLVITADLTDIDGKGKILGSAGPCLLRDQGYLPLQGYMQFDTADLATLETAGQLDEVILHEMGHVLGFGTIWEFNPGAGFTPNTFLMRTPTDPSFNGPAARAALLGLSGGIGFSGTGVPVEETGGSGTAFAHWRETSFVSELMSGWLNRGVNPISAVTVDQFRDLGYMVNDALADDYSFAALIQSVGAPRIALVEGTLDMPLLILDRQGRAVRRVERVLR